MIDTGPGIPAPQRQRVFEPHQRGGDSLGFGLGLAICHDLCQRFGWRLELSSPEAAAASPPQRPGTRALVAFASS